MKVSFVASKQLTFPETWYLWDLLAGKASITEAQTKTESSLYHPFHPSSYNQFARRCITTNMVHALIFEIEPGHNISMIFCKRQLTKDCIALSEDIGIRSIQLFLISIFENNSILLLMDCLVPLKGGILLQTRLGRNAWDLVGGLAWQIALIYSSFCTFISCSDISGSIGTPFIKIYLRY